MLKKIITVLMPIAFIAIFFSANSYFSEIRLDKKTVTEHLAKLTNSLFISPLSIEDLRGLCNCEITPISNQRLTFTLRVRYSGYMPSINNPNQIDAYNAAQAKSSIKICGLLNAQKKVVTSYRNSLTVTTYEGLPFASPQCNNLWGEGRAFFQPELN